MSQLVLTSNTLAGTPAAGTVEYNGQFYATDSAAARGQLQRITQATSVASTSGTSIDFTSIPAWVKKITVQLNVVSLSGTAAPLIQAGTGSTTYTTSGYLGSYGYFSNGGTPTTAQSTSGFTVFTNNATYVISGQFVLTNINGNNWVGSGSFTTNNGSTTNFQNWNSGSISLGAALTAVRVYTTNGTDTFDAGTINIMYEG